MIIRRSDTVGSLGRAWKVNQHQPLGEAPGVADSPFKSEFSGSSRIGRYQLDRLFSTRSVSIFPQPQVPVVRKWEILGKLNAIP